MSPVWCSRLWLTTSVQLAFCLDEFHGSRYETVRQPSGHGHELVTWAVDPSPTAPENPDVSNALKGDGAR
ncbi:hypothetical protein TNCV_671151 [Trichonephila clavipes]|nr:hypothetical protein TNCV_671151 [Trichonephila clavipes]